MLNANCVYAPDGTLAARYDKMHLFRYDNGRERYDEGRVLRAGAHAGGVRGRTALRVGLSVCYDLRFPELYRALMRPAVRPARRCRRRSPTRPAWRTGSCCCAPARSRTSAT